VHRVLAADGVQSVSVVLYVIASVILIAPRYNYLAKQTLLALLNVSAVFVFFFWPEPAGFWHFVVLVSAVLVHSLLVRAYNRSSNSDNRLFWTAFALPFLVLALALTQGRSVLGMSYMAFRMAQAVFEMRNDATAKTSLSEYIAFLLFPPTFWAGPINPWSYYNQTGDGTNVSLRNIGVGLLRIAVGIIKLRFLSVLPYQLTFSAELGDGFRHDWIDFLISGGAYYLYLYLNFSGYTDVAIGVAAAFGIHVKENFNNPLAARNVKDFWRRWHMSLTDFVRDAVFTPVSMGLNRQFGLRFARLAVLLAIVATFAVLALWHGVAIGYFIFYGLHAMAFAANQIWEDALRRRKMYERYIKRRAVRITAQALTFLFLAFTFAFLDLPTRADLAKAWAVMR
jgi:alginate O-acetyltransferase complex protein AlgI